MSFASVGGKPFILFGPQEESQLIKFLLNFPGRDIFIASEKIQLSPFRKTMLEYLCHDMYVKITLFFGF